MSGNKEDLLSKISNILNSSPTPTSTSTPTPTSTSTPTQQTGHASQNSSQMRYTSPLTVGMTSLPPSLQPHMLSQQSQQQQPVQQTVAQQRFLSLLQQSPEYMAKFRALQARLSSKQITKEQFDKEIGKIQIALTTQLQQHQMKQQPPLIPQSGSFITLPHAPNLRALAGNFTQQRQPSPSTPAAAAAAAGTISPSPLTQQQPSPSPSPPLSQQQQQQSSTVQKSQPIDDLGLSDEMKAHFLQFFKLTDRTEKTKLLKQVPGLTEIIQKFIKLKNLKNSAQQSQQQQQQTSPQPQITPTTTTTPQTPLGLLPPGVLHLPPQHLPRSAIQHQQQQQQQQQQQALAKSIQDQKQSRPAPSSKLPQQPAQKKSKTDRAGGARGKSAADQGTNINELNDVTRIAGLNLEEEEEEELIEDAVPSNIVDTFTPPSKLLQSDALRIKMMNRARKEGLKSIPDDVLEFMSLAVHERLRAIMEQLVEISKYRNEAMKSEFDVDITDDSPLKLMNREKIKKSKIMSERAQKEAAQKLQESNEEERKKKKQKKQEDDERSRRAAANLIADAVIGNVRLRHSKTPTSTNPQRILSLSSGSGLNLSSPITNITSALKSSSTQSLSLASKGNADNTNTKQQQQQLQQQQGGFIIRQTSRQLTISTIDVLHYLENEFELRKSIFLYRLYLKLKD